MKELQALSGRLSHVGLFFGDLLDAAWHDPAASLVLLALLGSSFGAAVDARKRRLDAGWSFRVWFNIATSAVFVAISVAWAIWLEGTAD